MTRVLIDTNILISAAYSRAGLPRLAFDKAVSLPSCHCLICEQTLEEFRRIASQKFPNRTSDFEGFIKQALLTMEVVPVPTEAYKEEGAIRDAKDRPILRAAIKAGADILLTGDKDFTECGLAAPKVMTAGEFVRTLGIPD